MDGDGGSSGRMPGLLRERVDQVGPCLRPAALKRYAIELYCLGLSMNAVAKHVGISAQSMLRWVRGHARYHCPKPEPTGRATVIEIDEVWHFVKKRSWKLWIWKAFERGTNRLIDWECGNRDQATLDRLLARLKRWSVRLFCTDDWAPYDAALPVGRHYIGKDQT
jgi:hypothetical protein